MPAGWNVRVTTFDSEGKPQLVRNFLAYESDKDRAVELVRKRVPVQQGELVEAIAEVAGNVLAGPGMRPGDVRRLPGKHRKMMRYKLGHRVHNSCASGSARRCSSAQSEPLRRRKAEWFETAQTRAWRPFQPRKRDEHNGSFASHANGDTCHMFGTRLRNRGGRRSSTGRKQPRRELYDLVRAIRSARSPPLLSSAIANTRFLRVPVPVAS